MIIQLSSAKICEIGLLSTITKSAITILIISARIRAVVTTLFSVFLSLFVMHFAVILETISGIPLDTSVKRTVKIEKLI